MARVISMFLLCLTIHPWAGAASVHLPEPTGPHNVGTLTLHLVDAERENSFTEDKDDKRELMVQVWYPAKPEVDAQPTFYAPKNEEAIKILFGTKASPPRKLKPEIIDSIIRPLKTHSFKDAPVSFTHSTYPILIFSHGYLGSMNQYTVQAEYLASHGYIVAAVNHTYYANIAIMPGESIITYKGKVNFGDAKKADQQLTDIVAVWTKDISFVVDELESLNEPGSDHALAGRIDFSRMGIYGHSFGGAAAGEVCSLDPRFKAGVNMDGYPYGHAIERGMSIPFLFIKAAREPANKPLLKARGMSVEDYDAIMDRLFDTSLAFSKMSRPGYIITFDKMRHLNFSDLPYFAHLSAFGKFVVGEFDPQEGGELINDLTRTFFDKYLKNENIAMPPQSVADHPLASVISHNTTP